MLLAYTFGQVMWTMFVFFMWVLFFWLLFTAIDLTAGFIAFALERREQWSLMTWLCE